MSIVHTKTNTAIVFYYIFLGLIALMPFHAFATTWIGTLVDNRALIQSWKEIVIATFSLYTLFWAIRDRALGKFLLNDRLNKIIIGYSIINFVILALTRPEATAALHGLKINLEFLALFVSAQAIIWRARPRHVDKVLSAVLIIGGLLVGLFGTIQGLFLPKDFLVQFGYGPQTILPYLPISGESDLFRILSTLGGPNQLGQYLILPIVCAMYRAWQSQKWWIASAVVPMLITLYFSHSRAAWIGLLAAIGVIVWKILGWRKALILATAFTGIAVIAGFLYLRNIPNGSTASYIIFHGRSVDNSVSNRDHVLAVKEAFIRTADHPFGYGPGTAGPAAYYLKSPQAIISENYYLQLAIEIGIVGLVTFLVLIVTVALTILRLPQHDLLAAPLLATLFAWSLINLVSHGWADSTSAHLWWGSAGAIIRRAK